MSRISHAPFDFLLGMINFFICHEPCKIHLCCGLIQLTTNRLHHVYCSSLSLLWCSSPYVVKALTSVVKASGQSLLY